MPLNRSARWQEGTTRRARARCPAGVHPITWDRKTRIAAQFAAAPRGLRAAISVDDPCTPTCLRAAAISFASRALVTNTGTLTLAAEEATLGPVSKY